MPQEDILGLGNTVIAVPHVRLKRHLLLQKQAVNGVQQANQREEFWHYGKNCPAEGGDGMGASVGVQFLGEHTTKSWTTYVVAPSDTTYKFKIGYVDDVTIMQFRFANGGSAGRFRKNYKGSQNLKWEMSKGQRGSITTECRNYGGPSSCLWTLDHRLHLYKEDPGSAYCAIPEHYRD